MVWAGLAFRHWGGFRVHARDGYVGFVEDMLFGSDTEAPAALAVRSQHLRSRVEFVPLDEIVEIVPSERRLVLRAIPPN